MGGAGGSAGTTGGAAGAVAVTGGGVAGVVAGGLTDGSGAVVAEAGGAAVTDGTGSGRSGVDSLSTFSLGASTLAVSGLSSRARFSDSPTGFSASLAGLSPSPWIALMAGSVMAGSVLAGSVLAGS